MKNEDSKQMTDLETNLLFKFVESMESQLEDFKADNLEPRLKDNLIKFEESLEKIKNII